MGGIYKFGCKFRGSKIEKYVLNLIILKGSYHLKTSRNFGVSYFGDLGERN